MRDATVRKIATAAGVVVWLYVALVLLLGTSTGRLYFGLDVLAVSVPVVGVATYFAARWGVARGLRALILRLSIASIVSVGCLFLADVLVSFYLNRSAVAVAESTGTSRMFDPTFTVGELQPPRYFPTNRNFRILKPNVSVTGSHRGEYYNAALRESPTLEALFAEYPVSLTIDEHGFRNDGPIDEADIFALGDSFTFGWAVDAEESWVGRLERSLGRQVYNLGIPGTSPKQHLELMKHLLSSRPDAIGITHLLWTVYEGNDLDDSYAERAPARNEAPDPWRTLSEGTVLEGIQSIPWRIRGQAIIHRLLTGDLTLQRPALEAVDDDAFLVDGVRSPFALLESAALGSRLFHPGFIEQAAAPASFVLDHPNRPRLDAVFEEMASLSEEHSFAVTVIIVPTAARLHGPFYEGFPQLSDRPHFADYVTARSRELGMDVLDLLPFFQPYADRELLYLRDDEHWNARGNALAAQVIRREVFP